jgi:hypothetical protein
VLDDIQVRDVEEAKTHLASLRVQVQELERRLRTEEKVSDTFILTPWWKRLWFAVNGWSLHELQERPQWRPWRR